MAVWWGYGGGPLRRFFRWYPANYCTHAKVLRQDTVGLPEYVEKRWWVNWWVETKKAPEGACLLDIWRKGRPTHPNTSSSNGLHYALKYH